MEKFILLLWEIPYHPHSYLQKLVKRFEAPSVVRVTRKDELRKFRAAPLFDAKYLVLFEDLRSLQDNLALIKFETMFPVLQVENRSQVDDAIFYLNAVKTEYRVYHNDFNREDAIKFVHEEAKMPVSESFCKAVVRHVGCSPLRILTAVSVCDQMGYTESVLRKYVDKWVYLDRRKLIEALLGIPRSAAAVRSAAVYLQMNRQWYKSVAKDMAEELSTILQIYSDHLDGTLRSDTLFDYLESKHLTRAHVTYALGLFERVSIATVFALREFIKTASLLEVAAMLAGRRSNVS